MANEQQEFMEDIPIFNEPTNLNMEAEIEDSTVESVTASVDIPDGGEISSTITDGGDNADFSMEINNSNQADIEASAKLDGDTLAATLTSDQTILDSATLKEVITETYDFRDDTLDSNLTASLTAEQSLGSNITLQETAEAVYNPDKGFDSAKLDVVLDGNWSTELADLSAEVNATYDMMTGNIDHSEKIELSKELSSEVTVSTTASHFVENNESNDTLQAEVAYELSENETASLSANHNDNTNEDTIMAQVEYTY